MLVSAMPEKIWKKRDTVHTYIRLEIIFILFIPRIFDSDFFLGKASFADELRAT